MSSVSLARIVHVVRELGVNSDSRLCRTGDAAAQLDVAYSTSDVRACVRARALGDMCAIVCNVVCVCACVCGVYGPGPPPCYDACTCISGLLRSVGGFFFCLLLILSAPRPDSDLSSCGYVCGESHNLLRNRPVIGHFHTSNYLKKLHTAPRLGMDRFSSTKDTHGP